MMKVAAHIGVLDEVELIGHCIANLRAQGVGRIWVQDMGSEDGTLDLLYADGGDDLVVVESGLEVTESEIEAVVERAVRDCEAWGAERVLLVDADEFVLTPGNDIGAALAGIEAPLAMMPRYNVVLGPDGLASGLPPDLARLDEVVVYAAADKWYRKKLEADPTLAWLRFVPLPKAAVRPGAFGGIVDGMHGALGPDRQPLPQPVLAPVVIAHVPMSSYERFERKVRNIVALDDRFGGNPPAHVGWHWRRWVASSRIGMLRTEYDNTFLDAAEMAALRADGVLKSVAELLQAGPAGDAEGGA